MKEKILEGKTIVISGGTKGVGKGVAMECLKQGANVVIGGRDEESAATIIEESAKSAGEAIFVKTDLHDVKNCENLFEVSMKTFNRVDGFLNYAGVTPAAALTECSEELYDEIFDIDIKAAFFCTQHAIRTMKINGGGSIILVGSTHAWRGEKDRTAYACAKGALLTLSNHISYHYAVDNIRCNYLVMGWTPTEGELALRKSQGISVECLHELASAAIPLGRMTEINDIVPGIMYLLSDYSAMVTGTTFRINGGESI
ncbi:MAG: SDR family oxidoreductase [Lachnospiraceae bacterium]|nr:SDR family oxidoreductase [Lachnospiraceae bacterium]